MDGGCFAAKCEVSALEREITRRRRRGRRGIGARVGGPTRILILKKFRRKGRGGGPENTPPRTRFPPS